ncbi:hypothetical protein D6C86_10264 [Aureobasidium pullulans]|uniref:Rhodopsin domain-containing protein n=1 Tax=Aureobasidium pullulans TaxID=5580 RepID=A0A4T0CNH7_AURPU|nr:hypothetical protein D6C94_10546 [Aureobasidium pullulans]THZ36275.1 hypothetical protein D6C87_09275 [Aureobasidium pullulans]THZ52255.1 hypothetical protein D6C86_10264 [Aureobasidium pullulans]TIA49601.1 hypothetical protein D6C77_09514 [Aureobasidium pullulans]
MRWVIDYPANIEVQSRYPTIVSVCVIFTSLMVAVVACRSYARNWLSRVYSVLVIVETRLGLGLPHSLPLEVVTDRLALLEYVSWPFYLLTGTGYKLATGFAALDLTRKSSMTANRQLIWLAIFIITLAQLVLLLLFLLRCQPLKKAWLPHAQGNCFGWGPLLYGTSVTTIVCDLFAFLQPFPIFLKTQISMKKKISLTGLFLLSFLTSVCSIIRICQVEAMLKTGDSTMLVMLGTIEICTGVRTVKIFDSKMSVYH